MKPFFVGYLPVPPALRSFLIVISMALIGFMAGFGLIAGTTQDDPGPAAYRFDYGRQNVTGVIELLPYPLLRVTEGTDRVPAGHTLMLVTPNKGSVMERAAPLDGQLAKASGIILERGDLDMMQVRGGRRGIAAADGSGDVPEAQPLGRWKLAGEICDGKCLAGAMRPGRGLAHKACANLCITTGAPPVFVSSQPVEGDEFLLIAGPDGGPMPADMLHFVGQYVSLEADIERRGDMLVMRLDPATVQVLP
ncbi:MAG: hypothetical protein AB8B51_18365 [Sedimentitalea sp.]